MKRKGLIAGALIVAELALCAGIIFTAWAGIGQLRASGIRLRAFTANYVSAESDEEQRFAVGTPAALSVENSAGGITVTGGEGTEIVVAAHKTAWGADQAEADQALAELKVIVTQQGTTVTVKVQQPVEVDLIRIGPGRSRVDFTITVPAETEVTANSESGRIAVSNTTGDADLQTSFGEISATDLGGRLKATTQNGEIVARRVDAGTRPVELRSSFGAIALDDSTGGDIAAHSNNGSIELTSVEASGTVNLTSDFGRIKFAEGRAASLDAQARNGAVTLTGLTVAGAVTVQSDFGSLSVEGVAAKSYGLTSQNGGITLDGANGAISVDTNFGDIDVTHAEDATLDLRTRNGAVQFSGSLGAGPHALGSDFGSIRLALPQDVQLTLDLKTERGKLTSALPVTISGEVSESHWRGTLNGGGAMLTAVTSNGDISLDILNP